MMATAEVVSILFDVVVLIEVLQMLDKLVMRYYVSLGRNQRRLVG